MTRASFWPFRNSLSKTFEMKCADVQITGTTNRAYSSSIILVDSTKSVCGLGRTADEAEINMRKEVDDVCNTLRDLVLGLRCGEE